MLQGGQKTAEVSGLAGKQGEVHASQAATIDGLAASLFKHLPAAEALVCESLVRGDVKAVVQIISGGAEINKGFWLSRELKSALGQAMQIAPDETFASLRSGELPLHTNAIRSAFASAILTVPAQNSETESNISSAVEIANVATTPGQQSVRRPQGLIQRKEDMIPSTPLTTLPQWKAVEAIISAAAEIPANKVAENLGRLELQHRPQGVILRSSTT